VRGNREELLKIRDERGIEILPDITFRQELQKTDLNSDEEAISEALIVSNSTLIGSTLKELRFRQRYNTNVLAIRRGEDIIRDRLHYVKLRFGDVLLVHGSKDSIAGLQTATPDL
jgi:uncharacterized protein with PhoU and TrkA domain